MSAGELQFRTAAFGGFQKQDVLDFIDSRSREQQEKLEALTRELEEGAKARAELEEELAAAKDRAECLAAEGETLSAQQKQAQEQAEALRAELEQTRARAEAAERGLADAQARLAKAEPAAAAYESVKDRTAGMELEAHCRAEQVEAEAAERVKKMREQVEHWLGRVQNEYDRLRTSMDATLSHAGGELEQVRGMLDGLSAELERQDEALEGLAETCRTELGPRPPRPLPLDAQ